MMSLPLLRTLTVPLLAALLAVTFVTAPAEAAVDTTAEQRFVDAVNAERAARGLSRLQPASDLRTAAREQSARMASRSELFHTVRLGDRITNWSRLAENVGRGPSSGRIHTALMNSTGHRANILDSRLTQIGVGVEVRGGQVWVTQIFRTPRTTSAVRFSDVAGTSTHADAITRLGRTGITSGCGSSRYCPDRRVTRAEMASFLARSAALLPHDPGHFRDLPRSNVHAANAEAIRASRITTGCGSDTYCPDRRVTRAEMASFLARSRGLSLGDGRTRFADVTDRSTHAAAIEAIAKAGITNGCGGDRFCPDRPVTRAEMASFLVRTFRL